MRKKLVYICSPCRGDMEKNITRAQGYCREVADLWPDVIPIAPHVYCTQFYDESMPEERAAGMEIGLALLNICDEIWVYGMANPSEGMVREIDFAKEHGIPIRDAATLYTAKQEGEPQTGELHAKLELISTGPDSDEVPEVHMDAPFLAEVIKYLRRNPGRNFVLTIEEQPEPETPGPYTGALEALETANLPAGTGDEVDP
ncbi:MAG: hypothetical protein LIP10_02835 [Clostridiales bacterium]|nr:hypothetical protein [Clostridiales bacterium]